MKPYTKYETGSWTTIMGETFKLPGTNISAPGKIFLKEKAELTSTEISMNVFPPGAAMPFSHRHNKNEEIYIALNGSAQFVVDGERIELNEGDILRVSSTAERAWRTVGEQNFCFLCIQAVEGSLGSFTTEDASIVSPSIDWSTVALKGSLTMRSPTPKGEQKPPNK